MHSFPRGCIVRIRLKTGRIRGDFQDQRVFSATENIQLCIDSVHRRITHDEQDIILKSSNMLTVKNVECYVVKILLENVALAVFTKNCSAKHSEMSLEVSSLMSLLICFLSWVWLSAGNANRSFIIRKLY